MNDHQYKQMPDIRILDPEGDGLMVVEVSIPTGPRTRRAVEFECEGREDAAGLAQSLLRRSQRPCVGDPIDAVLGLGLLNEGGP